MSLRGLAGVLGAVMAAACVLVLFPGLASACSCAPQSAFDRLAAGAPAVIGDVVAITDLGPVGQPSIDHVYAYTVRVERAFNLEAGADITIHGNTNHGTCGFTWAAGQRVGAFLYGAADRWSTGSCGLVAPETLEAAAAGLDPETSSDDGPVVRAFRGRRAVTAGVRSGKRLERLIVRPGVRIRLRLEAPARSVRAALARPNGERLGRTRAARAIGGSSVRWQTTLPRRLPRRADRLLVSIDYGTEGAVRAVGLATRCRTALKTPKPAP